MIRPHAVGDSISERFEDVRAQTLALAAPLSAEDQQIQSMDDASPTKWHLAHTTWFFETFLLKPHLTGYKPLDENYAYLFNSYYEALGARQPRPSRGLITRPTLAEVHQYRAHVDAAMQKLLEQDAEQFGDLTMLGLHHEQQHQELILMDIKHALSMNPLSPAYRPTHASAAHTTSSPHWIVLEGGLKEIGVTGANFSFDNEGPRHKVWLEPFQIADRLVTSGEWLAFMGDAGYRRPELWLSDGWAKVCADGWDAPLYWRKRETGWHVFTLSGEQPVDPAVPVCHVSYYEADAFARWSGRRLPTEAEWEVAAAHCGPATAPDLALHPAPASASGGMQQIVGSLWQWTASAYAAYPRYRPAKGALGEYNGKFMVNQFVLRGSSLATPDGHSRVTYRNFFYPHHRWQFTGLRLADYGT
ncbi:MAG: ergothioneine biosynthesis protein EgtB [Pseudomonadota bacterium]